MSSVLSKSFIALLRLVQLDCLHDVHVVFSSSLFFSCRLLLGLKFRAPSWIGLFLLT